MSCLSKGAFRLEGGCINCIEELVGQLGGIGGGFFSYEDIDSKIMCYDDSRIFYHTLVFHAY